ncbi:hypothetical protein HDU98_003390 [Podochytrium sp. JEL0797]|nr:hypothetical protein HDU98_003390 [Podochytrium sp. JEL0797]
MDWDPTPLEIVRYGVELPIYMIGIMVNVYTLVPFLAGKKAKRRYPRTRMNRILTLLLGVCLFWCVVSIARYLSWLFEDGSNSVGNTIESLLSPLTVMTIFALNLMLAMERWFVIHNWNDADSKKFFYPIPIWLGIFGGIMVWVYSTSTSEDSILPDFLNQRLVWIAVVSVSFSICIVAIIVLYTSTYLYTHRILKTLAPQSHQVDPNQVDLMNRVRIRLENKVMLYSVCFATSLLVCYFPQIMLNVAFTCGWVDPMDDTRGSAGMTWSCVANIFLALDMVITPCLVLFLGPRDAGGVAEDTELK